MQVGFVRLFRHFESSLVGRTELRRLTTPLPNLELTKFSLDCGICFRMSAEAARFGLHEMLPKARRVGDLAAAMDHDDSSLTDARLVRRCMLTNRC